MAEPSIFTGHPPPPVKESLTGRDRFPDAPPHIRALPRDHRGFPIPWFTAYIDGAPRFEVADAKKIPQAVKHQLCWICGKSLAGMVKAFVIGPMCAVNRVSSEPPSHWLCGVFAAQACPFLTKPRMRRQPRPEGGIDPAGVMIERNPGVTLVWGAQRFHPFRVDNGVLFEIGPPRRVRWFAEGREATRAEVVASIESGLPQLRDIAEAEGEVSMAEFQRRYERALKLLPRAA